LSWTAASFQKLYPLGAFGPAMRDIAGVGACAVPDRLVFFMDAADTIRESVAQVEQLRLKADRCTGLAAAVSEVKRYQSRRFAATYRDLIEGHGPYQAASNFFLTELYGDADYARRDAQFSRIAGAIQRLLPEAAVKTAVALAKLHLLTERLDQSLGLAWLQMQNASKKTGIHTRYCLAWRQTDERPLRELQLQVVLEVAGDLDQLTRTAGLRTVLRMMRGPAQAAGLADLQHFLELGFDTFATLGRQKGAVIEFLGIIQKRESALIAALFADTPGKAENYLNTLMADCNPSMR
jgi:hypothetical protein